jgi:hypothetical protein
MVDFYVFYVFYDFYELPNSLIDLLSADCFALSLIMPD